MVDEPLWRTGVVLSRYLSQPGTLHVNHYDFIVVMPSISSDLRNVMHAQTEAGGPSAKKRRQHLPFVCDLLTHLTAKFNSDDIRQIFCSSDAFYGSLRFHVTYDRHVTAG